MTRSGDHRIEATVHGRVQGVCYRASTQARAVELGVRGWVRNDPDGSVTLCGEGPAERLEGLLAWCHQGPPLAEVTRVDTAWGQPTGEFDGFEIRR